MKPSLCLVELEAALNELEANEPKFQLIGSSKVEPDSKNTERQEGEAEILGGLKAFGENLMPALSLNEMNVKESLSGSQKGKASAELKALVMKDIDVSYKVHQFRSCTICFEDVQLEGAYKHECNLTNTNPFLKNYANN